MSTDRLLFRIEARGYHISLDGPDVGKINPEYRWTVRCYTNERDAYNNPVDREMTHGASPSSALEQALAWINAREGANA